MMAVFMTISEVSRPVVKKSLSPPSIASSHIKPGDRIRRVVATHVLGEQQDLGSGAQRTPVHRSGAAIDLVVTADLAQQRRNRGPVDPHLRQLGGVELIQGMGKHCPLSATGGHRSPAELGLLIAQTPAVPSRNPHPLLAPVDIDRDDLLELIDQALVAQEAERQRFGMGAQGHQGHDLAIINHQGQRKLACNRHIAQPDHARRLP